MDSLNDYPRGLGPDLNPDLPGPKLMHFSSIVLCGFLSTPNKMSEWSLPSSGSQTMGEKNYRAI